MGVFVRMYVHVQILLWIYSCVRMCVATVIGFPAGTVFEAADVTVLWAAPGKP